MTVLVVGYGSMGRRRIRLIKRIKGNAGIVCVDSNEERCRQAREIGLQCYHDLDEALKKAKPQIAFVCTSPGSHASIILKLLRERIHVFTELNLESTGYEEIIDESKKNNVTVFMSSTLLYNRSIQRIKKLVEHSQKPLTYIYHVGQYLPDWHPWENYKDFFAGKKKTNGVREIFAIQLPWLISVFGEIDDLNAFGIRSTLLEIDFKDSVVATFRHRNGCIGTFTSDVVCRKATTHLEVIGEDLHLFWGGHFDDLYAYDMEKKKKQRVLIYDEVEHEAGYADTIIENQYEDEIKAFFDVVYRQAVPLYSLEMDWETMRIIDMIEKKCEKHP